MLMSVLRCALLVVALMWRAMLWCMLVLMQVVVLMSWFVAVADVDVDVVDRIIRFIIRMEFYLY